MEPTRLNPPPSDDAWIDALLRQDASSPLPDAGFSARVLTALPPRRRGFSAWRRPALCLVAALAGLAVALHAGGSSTEFFDACNQSIVGATEALASAAGGPGLALAILFVALVYVFVTEMEEERPRP